jgi:hypothetical protein
MHSLRCVHRRLRPGDGEDGLSQRTDPLYVGQWDHAAAGSAQQIIKRISRPRVWIYGARCFAWCAVSFTFSLVTRKSFSVDVIKDRGSLAREVGQGEIENVYRMQIMNGLEEKQRFTASACAVFPICAFLRTRNWKCQPLAFAIAARTPDSAVGGCGTLSWKDAVGCVRSSSIRRHMGRKSGKRNQLSMYLP